MPIFYKCAYVRCLILVNCDYLVQHLRFLTTSIGSLIEECVLSGLCKWAWAEVVLISCLCQCWSSLTWFILIGRIRSTIVEWIIINCHEVYLRWSYSFSCPRPRYIFTCYNPVILAPIHLMPGFAPFIINYCVITV